MKISAYNFKGEKSKNTKDPILMIHMTPTEALQTIISLSEQIASNSSNHKRLEQYDDKGIYFTIAVLENKNKGK